MQYEKTPVSKTSSKDVKRVTKTMKANALNNVSTSRMLVTIIRRHKLAISVFINILFIVNWAIPQFWTIIRSLI
jgi:hypothetical protein